MSFSNITNIEFSPEEIYLCKLLSDTEQINILEIKPSFIYDINRKCVRNVLKFSEDNIVCQGQNNSSYKEIPFENAISLPLWSEVRNLLSKKGFKLEFHYDPFSKDEPIHLGFMRPKKGEDSESIVIEVEGKTDLECIYKVMLEALKFDNTP